VDDALSRRTALAAAGGAALAAAGCTPDAAAPTGPATGGEATTGPPRPLAVLADLPIGHPIPAVADDGTPLLLIRSGPAQVLGLDARCPHAGCVVRLMGAQLTCPCHNSRFEPTTGKRIRGLTPTGLRPFPVRVQNGAVLPG
jgi:nitrite reductase/ring-hydroxylating ferredoxin subunit